MGYVPPAQNSVDTQSIGYFMRRNKFILFSLLLLVFIIHVLLFKLAYVDEGNRLRGWVDLRKAENIPEQYPRAGVVYKLEGTIKDMKEGYLLLEDGGKEQKFMWPGLRYTLVTPFQYFEEWPTKVIGEWPNKNEQKIPSDKFKTGDRVYVLMRAQQLSDKFFPERVIKVKNSNE